MTWLQLRVMGMQANLYSGHDTLVVVAKPDDAGSRGSYLGDVDVGSGEAVECGEAGVHVDAMLQHGTYGQQENSLQSHSWKTD